MLMNLNNISLPYPVLGISDDILPLLPDDSVAVKVDSDNNSYTFYVDLNFNNNDIQDFINSGFAEFSCEYDCARTMLRRCVKSSFPRFEINVNRKEINGRINFNCFVSVKKTINHYVNKGFNSDYDGFSFFMEPGDILVAFPQFHYDVDIKYDKLQAAGSFMQIRESDLHENVFFDISGNKIEILLPTQLYNLYCDPRIKGAAEIIHSSLVLNALTYALNDLKVEHTDDNRLWARTIYYRLENEDGLSIRDLEEKAYIPVLAQKLLKDPYLRLFNHIINSNSNPLSDDE